MGIIVEQVMPSIYSGQGDNGRKSKIVMTMEEYERLGKPTIGDTLKVDFLVLCEPMMSTEDQSEYDLK
jgi:hypothetical protein